MRAAGRLAIRLLRVLPFSVYFAWELMVANLMVAWEIITPRHYMRPGVIRVTLRSTRPWEVVLMANLISLTPGTLTIEVEEDPWALYVHALHLPPDRLRARVRKLEDRLHWVVR